MDAYLIYSTLQAPLLANLVAHNKDKSDSLRALDLNRGEQEERSECNEGERLTPGALRGPEARGRPPYRYRPGILSEE